MIGYLLIISGICLSLLGVWIIAKDNAVEKDCVENEPQPLSTTQQFDSLEDNSNDTVPVSPNTTKQEDEKGTKFEGHIVDLFQIKEHSNYRELLEWQGDKYSNGVYPKSNCNPDLVVKIKVAREECKILGVECKWRKAFVNDTLTWARPEQIDRYVQFGKDRGASVFVALGVGGTESHPDELFIVPISQMTDPVIHRAALQPYKQKNVDGFLYYDKLKDCLFVI